MKRYKIGKYIIDAESPVKAMKIVKAIKDSAIKDARTVLASKLKKGDVILDNKNNPYKITSIDYEDGYVSLYADNLTEIGNARFTFDNDENVKLKDSAIKDDIVSELPSELDAAKQYARNANYQAVVNICWRIVDRLKRMKLADADNSDIDYLSKEERKAIADYKAAIANTKDPKLLRLFAHILNEEIEHLEELQSSEIHDADYEAYLNGRLLKRGDELTDFRGGKAWFYGCYHPRKITVLTKQNDPTSTMEYYPSVFNVETKDSIKDDLNTADKIIMATEIVRKVMSGAEPRDYGGTIGYRVYPNEISKVIDLLKRQFPNIKVKKHVNGISGEIEILKNSLN